MGRGDFAGDLPRLADVVQDDRVAELLGDPEGGEDVVVAVGVVLHDALAVEHLDEFLQGEVAGRHFFRVAVGAPDFFPVFLRLDVLLADERGGLGAGAGERGAADGVGAVGHLEAAGVGAVGELDQQAVDGGGGAELEVEGLAADEVAGAGHDVDRGEAAGPGLLEGRIAGVDRVEHPGVRLEGAGAVAAAARPDVAVGIDQAGHQHPAGGVNDLGVGGDGHLADGAEGDDLPVLDDEHAGGDGIADDRDELRPGEDEGFFLGTDREGEDREARQAAKRAKMHVAGR